MYLEKRPLQRATVLDGYGSFNEEDHEPFIKTLETLHTQGCRHLVVNLTSVYHLDGNMIGVLKFAHDYFTSGNGELSLVCPLSAVRCELEAAGIPSLIPTYMTVYDSLHRRNTALKKSAIANSAHQLRQSESVPGQLFAPDQEEVGNLPNLDMVVVEEHPMRSGEPQPMGG